MKNDPITAKLIVTSLKDPISFEPLSYTWGDACITKEIEVDKQVCSITRNLFSALQNLRKQTESRFLWVDAVCINQEDNVEKSYQVKSMHHIYAGSHNCLIYLGDFLDVGFTEVEAEDTLNVIRTLLDGESREFRVSTKRIAEGMDAFRNSEWWKRFWTIQEVVLSHDASFVWGSLSISWETLSAAADALIEGSYYLPNDEYLNDAFEGIKFTAPIVEIKFLREFWRGEMVLTPIDVLRRLGSSRHATDPRDTIYAVANLLSKLFPIDTDYSLTTVQVYSRAVIGMINATRSLKCWIGIRGKVGKTNGLPSWAIDWDDVDDPYEKLDWFWDHCWRYYNNNADDGRPLKWSTNKEETVLTLDGVLVDSITVVGAAPLNLEMDWTLRVDPKAVQAIIREWYEVARKHFEDEDLPDDQSENWQERFWNAVSGEEINDQDPGGATNIQAFAPGDVEKFEQFRTVDEIPDWNAFEVYVTLNMNVPRQSFFITKKGFMGTGPPKLKAGDEAWVLCGGSVPFILRPLESKSRDLAGKGLAFVADGNKCYHLLGDGFVHGIMNGEAIKLHEGSMTQAHLV